MQIVELKVNVEKSQLAQLEAQVNKLDGKKIDLKVNVQGLQGINKEMTNFVNAMARYQGASAKIASANAKQRESDNKLAIAQEKTTQTANKKAEAHSKLLTQMQRTQQEERKLQTQIQKTNQERQKSVTQAGKVRAEEVKLQQQMERTRRVQEQNAKGAKAYGDSMQKAGKEVSGFQRLMGGSLGEIAGRMFMWQAMGEAVSIPIRAMKEAVDTMKAVDDRMVEIRKVTDLNKQQLEVLETQAYKTASAYGETADSYLQNVAAFAKAGYQGQASAMAELSTKTQIVADTTADIANQFLLSTDAAYKYNGSIEALTKVLDGANEIENNNATSIEKIAEGLGLVAPISAQARMGVDELTAAIGTITAVTQRSGAESARAMRALILNILGDTQTEVEEGVTLTTEQINNMKDVLKQYAPEALKAAEATGEVVNPMKAIEGLAKAFQDGVISEQKLMEIVTDIGGKLRSSQLLALVQNWDMYEKMLAEYQNAAGSADREIENAMDSWSRKVNVLKNTWTEFVNNIVSTDAIKGALDGVTSIFSAINDGINAAKESEGFWDFWDNFWKSSNERKTQGEIDDIKKLEDEIKNLTSAGSEYQSLVEKRDTTGLNKQEERRLAFLMAQEETLKRQVKLEREQAFERFQKEHGADTNKGYGEENDKWLDQIQVSKDVEATNKLKKAQDELFQSFKDGKINLQEYREGLSEIITENGTLFETLSEFDEWGMDLSPAQEEFLNFYNWMLDTLSGTDTDLKIDIALNGLEEAKAGVGEFAGNVVIDSEKVRKALADVGLSAEEIEEALADLEARGVVSIDIENEGTEELLSDLEELGIAVRDLETGEIKIDVEALGELGDILGLSQEQVTKFLQKLREADNVTLTNAKGEIVGVETALTNLSQKPPLELVATVKDDASDKLTGIQGKFEEYDGSTATADLEANDNASKTVDGAQDKVDKLDKSKATPKLTATDGISGPATKAKNAVLSVPKTHTTKFSGDTSALSTAVSRAKALIQSAFAAGSGTPSGSTSSGGKSVSGRPSQFATGTTRTQGGAALLGDELSSDGSPRPELVIRRTGDAFLAGVNGPVVTTLPAGARVYSFRETQDIFSGRDIVDIPAYASGLKSGGLKSGTLSRLRREGQAIRNGTSTMPVTRATTAKPATTNTKPASTNTKPATSAKPSTNTKPASTSTKPSTSKPASTSGSSSSSGTDEYLESLKKQLDVLEAQYSFLDASGAETDALIGKSREIQGQLHTINNYLRTTGGEEKDIWDNSAKWHQELKKIQETQRAVYQKERELLESELELYEAQGWSVEDQVEKLKQVQKTLEGEANYLRSIKAEQTEINALSVDWMVLYEKRVELERSVFQKRRSDLEIELDLYEKQNWGVSYRVGKLKEIQNTLRDEANYLRKIGAAQSEVNQLSIEWMEVQEQILQIQRDLLSELDNAIAKELKEAQEVRDAEIGLIDKEIKKLQEAREIQEDQLALEEKRKKVEEARFALENAQNERTVRYFNKEKNQWEWGADPTQVKSAKDNLENAEKDLADYLADKAFNEQIKALEAQKDDINRRYDDLEARWTRLSDAFAEPVRDIRDILRDMLATGAMTEEQVRLVKELVGDIKEYSGQIVESVSGTRAATVARAADGSTYNIGSKKGIDFVNSAPVGATMTGGDGSTWAKNADLTTTITKNGKSYTTSGNVSYDIGSERGLDFIANASPGATMTGGDGSEWIKHPDGSVTIQKNGTTYSVSSSATNGSQTRTAISETGEKYLVGSRRGLDFISSAEYGDTMTGGDGSIWKKMANGTTVITKNGKTYTVYDSGGILSGIGGIKATYGDEMILSPEITNFMLRPTADRRFMERMSELHYIYGNGPVPSVLKGRSGSQDHYGDVYTFGNVTLTEEKAKSTTVYELAQMSRSLGVYRNS